MDIRDYLKNGTKKRRILIVSDLLKGEAILRSFEASEGLPVCNVVCMTIAQIVDTLYLWTQAEFGFDAGEQYIDAEVVQSILRSILFREMDSLKYFNVEKMMNLATTSEIVHKVNLIRADGWKDADSAKTGEVLATGFASELSSEALSDSALDRLSDLSKLVEAFEQFLSSENLLDSLGKCRLAVTALKEAEDLKAELDLLFGAEISYLVEETEKFTGIELELLNMLLTSGGEAVSMFPENLLACAFEGCRGKAAFFKGYGSFNEANYVANDILQKGIPTGDVTVLYGSPTQVPAILSALRGNGIPMRVVSPYPAKNNGLLALVNRILDWASDGFTEKALEAVLASPMLYLEGVDKEGNPKNILGGQKYFGHILEPRERRDNSFVLGWDYARNAEFLRHERSHVDSLIKDRSQAETDEDEAFLDFFENLLKIFGFAGNVYSESNKIFPANVYDKLLTFLDDYGNKRSEEYGVAMAALNKLFRAVEMEKRLMSLSEVIQYLGELMASLSIEEKIDSGMVKVQQMGDWCLLDRPNVYVIGLSIKDMQGNTTQSPVLFDQEMLDLCGPGYKPAIKNQAEMREMNFYRTMATFTGEQISFGYSSYDTVGFCESNPSVFYREAMKQLSGGSVEELCEFVYGNPKESTGDLLAPDFKKKDSCEVRLMTSNSSLELLLDCPRKYAYEKLLGIPDLTFAEENFTRWLDAAARGNFFHEIAERYVKERLIRPASESYGTDVDGDLVRDIALDIKLRFLEMYPVAFPGLADHEAEEMIKYSVDYLKLLLQDYADDAGHRGSCWRGLAAEQRFTGATYEVEDFEGNRYEFSFSGFIDRIDYRADRNAKTIYLRIADYKTGRKEAKKKANELGKLVQYAVYERAVMETGRTQDPDIPLLQALKEKVAFLEGDPSVKDWTFVFDCFQYIFPMEKNDIEPLTIFGDELEGTNLVRLKSILTLIKTENLYPDHYDLYSYLDPLVLRYPEAAPWISGLRGAMCSPTKRGDVLVADEYKGCGYCSYSELCEHKKEGLLG